MLAVVRNLKAQIDQLLPCDIRHARIDLKQLFDSPLLVLAQMLILISRQKILVDMRSAAIAPDVFHRVLNRAKNHIPDLAGE